MTDKELHRTISQYRTAKIQEKLAQEQAETLKHILKQEFATRNTTRQAIDGLQRTISTRERRGVDVKRLRENAPRTYKKYETITTYDVLTVKEVLQ